MRYRPWYLSSFGLDAGAKAARFPRELTSAGAHSMALACVLRLLERAPTCTENVPSESTVLDTIESELVERITTPARPPVLRAIDCRELAFERFLGCSALGLPHLWTLEKLSKRHGARYGARATSLSVIA